MRQYLHNYVAILIVLTISILCVILLRLYGVLNLSPTNTQGQIAMQTGLRDVLQSAQTPPISQPINFKSYSAFYYNTNVTNISVNKPSAAPDDVMILHVAVKKSTTSMLNIYPPSGWTLINRNDTTDNTVTSMIFFKIVSSSEPSVYMFPLNTPSKSVGGIAVYSGVNHQSPVDTYSSQITMTSSQIIARSINAMVTGEMLIMFASYGSDTQISPPTDMGTKIWNIVSASTNGITSMMSHKLLPAAGPVGDKYAYPQITGFPGIGQLVLLKPASTAIPQDNPTQPPYITPTPTPHTQFPTYYPTYSPTPIPHTQYTYPTITPLSTSAPTSYYHYPYPTYMPYKTPTPMPNHAYSASAAYYPTLTPAQNSNPYSYPANYSISQTPYYYPSPTRGMVIINYPVIPVVPGIYTSDNQTIPNANNPAASPEIEIQTTPNPTRALTISSVTTAQTQIIPVLIVPVSQQAFSGKQTISVEGENGTHVEFSIQPIGTQMGSLFIGRTTINLSGNRGSYEWDTTNVPNGSYQLFAKFIKDDGTNFLLKPVDINVNNDNLQAKNSTQKNIVFPADFNPAKITVDQQTNIEKIINTQTEDKKVGLTFNGKSVPNSIITLLIYSNPIVVTVKTDANGSWTYTLEKPLDPGKHAVYTIATKQTGEKIRSEVSEFIIATGYAASYNNESLILESANGSPAIYQFIYSTIFIVIIGIFALFILFSLKIRHRQL